MKLSVKIKWIITWITSFYSSEFQKLHFNEVLHYFLENVMNLENEIFHSYLSIDQISSVQLFKDKTLKSFIFT